MTKHRHILIAAGIVIMFLAGCVGIPPMDKLEVGMTKEQVIEILGKPDGYDPQYNSELLWYYSRMTHSGEFANYYAWIKNGKLYGWSRGDIEQRTPKNAGVVTVVPLPPPKTD